MVIGDMELLPPSEFAAIKSHLDAVDSRFSECDAELKPERRAQRDKENLIKPDSTEYWFYSANYIDLVVSGAMTYSRQILQKFANETVDRIAE
jgi:hypothetical protein